MAGELEFCLLGPLVVRSGGAVVPVRQAKQRVLLAALLLSGIPEVLLVTGWQPGAGPGGGHGQRLTG